MSTEALIIKLRLTLQRFFVDPENVINNAELIAVAGEIHRDALSNGKVGPDELYSYMGEHVITPALKNMQKISSQIAKFFEPLLDYLESNVDVGEDETQAKMQARCVLVFIYYGPLQNLVVMSQAEEQTRDALFSIGKTVEQFKITKPALAANLQLAHTQLQTLVDNHFQQSLDEQKKSYPSFAKEVQELCKNHKNIIESSILTKKLFYNFLAAIAGLVLFYGLYLAVTYQTRGGFFLQPAEEQKATTIFDHLSDCISPRR